MDAVIIDSDFMSLEAALRGLDFPKSIRRTLALVDVDYISFDEQRHRGQIVIHKDLADDVRWFFARFLEIGFWVYQAVPMCVYEWDDDRSMEANNSSAFNYRLIKGTDRLSNHAFCALDINPVQNPYFARDGNVYPPGATYDLSVPGTVTPEVVAIFEERGWTIWGGNWTVPVDYQHFEKPR